MSATYTPIASATLGADAASVTFNSIPQTYTDLILIASARSTRAATADNSGIRFNSDSGTNYSFTRLWGSGTGAFSSRATNETYAYSRINAASITAGVFSPIIHNIMNYSNTITNKTVLTRGNATGDAVELNVSLWRNTAAITSITFFAENGNLLLGSTFNLYGILGANA
jgi:hypothetical protein